MGVPSEGPSENVPAPEDRESMDRAGLDRPSIQGEWRRRIARMRLEAGSRPTSGAYEQVDETALRIRRALRKAPSDRHRMVLAMRIFRGLSNEKIAEQLGIPANDVSRLYEEGLQVMREELKDEL